MQRVFLSVLLMSEFSEKSDTVDPLLPHDRQPELDSSNVQRISSAARKKLKETVYRRPPEVMGDCLNNQNYTGIALYLSVLYGKQSISIDTEALIRELQEQLQEDQADGKPVASAHVYLQNGDSFSIHAVHSREFGYSKAVFSSSNPAIVEALKT